MFNVPTSSGWSCICLLQVTSGPTMHSVMNTLWLQRCRMAAVLSCRSQYSILNNISSTKQHSLRVQLPSWRVKKAFLYQLRRWNTECFERFIALTSLDAGSSSPCRVTALYFRRSNGTVFIFTTCLTIHISKYYTFWRKICCQREIIITQSPVLKYWPRGTEEQHIVVKITAT